MIQHPARIRTDPQKFGIDVHRKLPAILIYFPGTPALACEQQASFRIPFRKVLAITPDRFRVCPPDGRGKENINTTVHFPQEEKSLQP